MAILECSKERPWGIHQSLRLDQACPRCGWVDEEERGPAWPPLTVVPSTYDPPEALAA
jgi:hypothetical protein